MPRYLVLETEDTEELIRLLADTETTVLLQTINIESEKDEILQNAKQENGNK